jgi:hypothetical protein
VLVDGVAAGVLAGLDVVELDESELELGVGVVAGLSLEEVVARLSLR